MQFQAPKLPLFELKGWKNNKNFLGVVLADKQIFLRIMTQQILRDPKDLIKKAAWWFFMPLLGCFCLQRFYRFLEEFFPACN